ncbi:MULTISPECIES: ABC transporter permease [Micromonospora]
MGLSSVRHRTQEIGIHRSLGASRGDVFRLVLLETVAVTVLAGFSGAVLARLVLDFAPSIQGADLASTSIVQPSLVGFAVAVSIGLMVGIVPALRATRLDVIAAIRN